MDHKLKKVFVLYMKQMQLVIAYCSWGSGGAVSLSVGPGQCPGGLLESFRVKFESKIKFNLNLLKKHFLWVFPGIDMFLSTVRNRYTLALLFIVSCNPAVWKLLIMKKSKKSNINFVAILFASIDRFERTLTVLF